MIINLPGGSHFDLSDGRNWTLVQEGKPDRFYGNADQAWAGAMRVMGLALTDWPCLAGREVALAMDALGFGLLRFPKLKTEKAGYHVVCGGGYTIMDSDSMNWDVVRPVGHASHHGTLQSALRAILWDAFMRRGKTLSWDACGEELALCARETIGLSRSSTDCRAVTPHQSVSG